MGDKETLFGYPIVWLPKTQEEAMDYVELDNMMLAVLASVSEELAESFAQEAETNYSTMEIFIHDTLTVRVKQRVFGKQLLYEEIKYPADWKQAFKERWFPEWAKNRWPVLYATRKFDVRELVPTLAIPGHESLIVTEVT